MASILKSYLIISTLTWVYSKLHKPRTPSLSLQKCPLGTYAQDGDQIIFFHPELSYFAGDAEGRQEAWDWDWFTDEGVEVGPDVVATYARAV